MSKKAKKAARDYILSSASPSPITETAAVLYGYTRAEQDLALTAEDVSCIIHLADQFGKDYQKIADVFNRDRENEPR